MEGTQGNGSGEGSPKGGAGVRWALGAVLLAVFVAVLHWNTAGVVLTRDEGEYAYSAWLLSQGGMPYSEAFLQKPPMVVYTYLSGLWLDDGSGVAFRWLAALFQVGAALVMGEIARREVGEGAVWPARLMMPVMMLMPGLSQFTANTEQFLMLPLLGVWLVKAARGAAASWRAWFAAGCLAGVCVMYKYTCVPLLAVIFVAWGIEAWRASGGVRQLAVKAGVAAAGAVLTGLVILSPFLIHDGGRCVYDCTVRFNRAYAGAHLMDVSNLGGNLSVLGAAWWPLVLFAGLWAWTRPKAGWFCLALLAGGLLGTSGSVYQHYYLLLLPAFVLAAAGGADAAAQWACQRTMGRESAVRLGVCVVIAVCVLYPNTSVLLMEPEVFAQAKFGKSSFGDAPILAAKLAEVTAPGDRVLVAGSEPELLYAAKRRSATRFVIVYPMMLVTPLAEGYQREAIDELKRQPPKAVVAVQVESSWMGTTGTPELFHKYLEELLAREYRVAGGYMHAREGDAQGWVDGPDAARVDGTGMILFVRNP
jgi:4-amino-4-deoxy-L-arabinose transferase-like glycosyltransferase